MPEPTKIPRPFADSGDKNSIPDSSGGLGFASWQEGFPAITGTPFAQGGVAPKRADFNGIFNALSAAIVWAQQGGVYGYDATTDYEVGNVVLYSGDLYKCLAANGPSSTVKSPTDGTIWAKMILSTATTNADGYMSATDKTLVDTIPDLGTFSRMFFSQTSGNYVAPRTGVYKITIKGGGGGGGGGLSSNNYNTGGSGGEGCTLVFYKTLTKDQSYPYVIGAGGTAGTSDASTPTAGSQGGTTSFNNEYSCVGGYGGLTPGNRAGYGAYGTSSYTVPVGAEYYVIYGQNGFPGMSLNVSGAKIGQPPGGGAGGTQNANAFTGGGGGGGGGSGADKAARPGGDGYILVEYQG